MPRLSKVGAAALAAFGWTGLQTVSASYLVVAGGGGAGGDLGAGGGAGGLLTGTASLNPTLTYTITVGAGGAGDVNAANGVNGSNSVISVVSITAIGGGGGAGDTSKAGNNGGSGGGGQGTSAGTGTSGQGNNGGLGRTGDAGGGGGGASAVGGAGTLNTGGNGGNGSASSISGSSVTYAGGGGGGGSISRGGSAGTGGTGGGGNGNGVSSGAGSAGTANLGGGGGGGSIYGGDGGAGGSGIVIISYTGPQQFGGGIVTISGSNVIHTFNTSGTLSPLSSLTASYLVVAGGGGGGGATSLASNGGSGGGAGGLRSGSGLIFDTNSIYPITVGAGGTAGTSSGGAAGKGNDSTFSSITSTGGGYGIQSGGAANGGSGGSGGGAAGGGTVGSGNTPSTSPSQGNNGGSGLGSACGGGGGAGAVGGNASGAGQDIGGNGGAGSASSISGSSVTYAGGGGAGGYTSAGTGGSGGGGNGGDSPTSGTANRGGGGGGANGSIGASTGGSGGSGVVIISYAGSTQQMAGGTVTISGGNVIHTFTSSGYLTPIKYVNNSLRFRSSAQSYLSRTLTTPTNNKKWSYSVWMKRGSLSANRTIMSSNVDGAEYWDMRFNTSDQIYIQNRVGSSNLLLANTTAVYRDPAAWYHIVFVFDSANATAANRNLLYVNGVNVALSANSGSSDASAWNTSGVQHNIGVSRTLTSGGGIWAEYDGYETEVNFIDGQALTPNSFGTFNSYGVWQPITYGGSYGTNGFYLPFTNKTSTTTLGYDFSPNGNNWTTNNISLTAGSTYDSMTDVPTLTSATAANYCVMNPLDVPTSGSPATLSNGNLACVTPSAGYGFTTGTIAASSGKWYWEYVATAGSPNLCLGFGLTTCARTYGGDTGSYIYYAGDGKTYANAGAGVTYGATWTTGDVMGVALNLDAGTAIFYKNNVSQGTAFTGLSGTFFPIFSDQSPSVSNTFTVNFGQQPFTYTPPSGYVALNTYNLA